MSGLGVLIGTKSTPFHYIVVSMTEEKKGLSAIFSPKVEEKKPTFGAEIKASLGNSFRTTYWLYKSESMEILDKIPEPFTHNNGTACFSSLPSYLQGKEAIYNRMLYVIEDTGIREKIVQPDERILWVKLSIANRTLPSYILSNKMIESNKYVIKLDEEGLSPSLLYVYLCTLRVMRDDPEFVRNILTLVDKYRMSYYLAWDFASKFSHSATGHNLVPHSRSGGIVDSDVNKIKSISLKYALTLKAYLQNPQEYDKRSIYSGLRFGAFDAFSKAISMFRLKPPDVKDIYVDAPLLLSDKVVRLMESTNTKEVNSLLKEIRNEQCKTT